MCCIKLGAELEIPASLQDAEEAERNMNNRNADVQERARNTAVQDLQVPPYDGGQTLNYGVEERSNVSAASNNDFVQAQARNAVAPEASNAMAGIQFGNPAGSERSSNAFYGGHASNPGIPQRSGSAEVVGHARSAHAEDGGRANYLSTGNAIFRAHQFNSNTQVRSGYGRVGGQTRAFGIIERSGDVVYERQAGYAIDQERSAHAAEAGGNLRYLSAPERSANAFFAEPVPMSSSVPIFRRQRRNSGVQERAGCTEAGAQAFSGSAEIARQTTYLGGIERAGNAASRAQARNIQLHERPSFADARAEAQYSGIHARSGSAEVERQTNYMPFAERLENSAFRAQSRGAVAEERSDHASNNASDCLGRDYDQHARQLAAESHNNFNVLQQARIAHGECTLLNPNKYVNHAVPTLDTGRSSSSSSDSENIATGDRNAIAATSAALSTAEPKQNLANAVPASKPNNNANDGSASYEGNGSTPASSVCDMEVDQTIKTDADKITKSSSEKKVYFLVPDEEPHAPAIGSDKNPFTATNEKQKEKDTDFKLMQFLKQTRAQKKALGAVDKNLTCKFLYLHKDEANKDVITEELKELVYMLPIEIPLPTVLGGQHTEVKTKYFMLSEAGATDYIGAVAMSNGTVQLRLRRGVRIDFTVDGGIRVLSYRNMMAVAISADQLKSAVIFPNGRVLHKGNAVEAVTYSEDVANTLPRFAKIRQGDRCTFTYKSYADVFKLDSCGTTITTDTFKSWQKDYTLSVFLSGSRVGKAFVKHAEQLVESGNVSVDATGTETYTIGNYIVTQQTDGLVKVKYANALDYAIKVSAAFGSLILETGILRVTASVGEEFHLFVRYDEKRLHSNNHAFTMRNSGFAAAFTKKQELIVY